VRLVGPEAPLEHHPADAAADLALAALAEQLPSVAGPLGSALAEWRGRLSPAWGSDETEPLAQSTAPFILQSADEDDLQELELAAGAGELAQSAHLLAAPRAGRELGLRQFECALAPFLGARPEHVGAAASRLAAASSAGGVLVPLLEIAADQWMDAGASAGGLAIPLLQAAVDAWQSEGASDEGVSVLREVQSWLHSQLLADMRQKPPVFAPQTLAAVVSLGDLIAVLDGAIPSLGRLAEIRRYIDLGQEGRPVFQGAAVAALCAAVPGMPEAAMAPLFDQWWAGRTGMRQFVQAVTACVAQECRDETKRRIAATWGDKPPPDGYYPSYRVNDKRVAQKVPWFLPMWAIEAAEEVDPAAMVPRWNVEPAARAAHEGMLTDWQPPRNTSFKEPDRDPDDPISKLAKSEGLAATWAKALTNGRCIYCGSTYEVTPRLIFPAVLGGGDRGNCGDVCKVCLDWKSKLGTKLWHKVLMTPPEEVAETWWESQRKANERVAGFLERMKAEKEEKLSGALPRDS